MSTSTSTSPLLQPAPSAKVGSIYLVLMLIGFAGSAGLTVLYVMLATLYREYNGSSGVGWAVTLYLLVSAISAALCGRLGDLLGRRFMILVMLSLAGLGALLSALLPALAGVVAGCALQGVAGALTPLSIGLAREELPTDRVPVAMGVVACSGMFGAGVAFLLGGVVVDHFASHGGFFLKALISVFAFAAVALIVPRARRAPSSLKNVDMLRGILFAPAIGLALLTLEMRRSWGITDPRVLGGFVVSALLLAYWVRHQAAQAVPLIDVRMLAKPGIALPNIAMIFLGLGAIQLGQTLSLLLPQPSWTGIGLGLAATAVGWFMLPLNSMTIIVGPLAGRISRRIGAHGVALIGASACLIAWLMMVQWHGSLGQVIAAAVICTMGYGMLMPSIFNLIAEASPVERASEAAGVNQVCLVAFMAVGSQLLFGLLGSDKVSDAAHGSVAFPSATAFGSVFVYLASMSACCLVVLLVIAGHRHITAFGKLGTVQEKQA